MGKTKNGVSIQPRVKDIITVLIATLEALMGFPGALMAKEPATVQEMEET